MSQRPMAIVLVLLGAQTALAGGFRINEQGAAAVGKAGAYVADARDPSAIAYNPAGLAALDGLQVYVGLSLVAPSVSFDNSTTNVTTKATLACNLAEESLCSPDIAPIPNLYLSYQLTSDSTIGLGISAPFGLGLRWDWEDDSPERFVIREQSLSTVFISPAIAFDASSYIVGLSVALGADLVPAHIYLQRDIPLGEAEGSVRLSGDGTGAGARFGLLYTPLALPGVRFGLTWRSPVTLSFGGRANFSVDEGVPRSVLPPDGKASTKLTLPQSVAIGFAFAPFSWMEFEADFEWVDWSVYDSVVINMPDDSTSTDGKDWHDSFAVRAGLVLSFSPVSVRAGAAFDTSPVPDTRLSPGLPDGDRLMAAGGVGVQFSERVRLEVAGLYVPTVERKTSSKSGEPADKGTYSISAWALSMGLSMSFDTAAETPMEQQGPDGTTEESAKDGTDATADDGRPF